MIAHGKPCVHVAGNHEVAAAANDPVMASAAGVPLLSTASRGLRTRRPRSAA